MSGIRIEELSFDYDGRSVFEDLTFHVEQGEVLIILGPNGSGKTTLIKCLNLLLKPKGSVLVDMHDVTSMKKRELAKIVGYVPQNHSPIFPYRVIDVVVGGRTPHLGFSAPSSEDYKQAYASLERLNISYLADRAYTQISGGELRMVLIARALVQQPRFLLLDEPTSHLDLANRMIVFKALREMAREGVGIVASEHDPNMATLSSDKVAFLKDGRLLTWGSACEVLTSGNIARTYGIEAEIIEKNGIRYVLPLMHHV